MFLLLWELEVWGFECFFWPPDEGFTIESVSDCVSLPLAFIFIKFFTPVSS